MGILNLTQHAATDAQKAEGVFDLSPELREKLSEYLTFLKKPTGQEVIDRAMFLERFAIEHTDEDCFKVMLGGAPFLMHVLHTAFENDGWDVVYAFSERVSIDIQQADGSVKKQSVFNHAGFVSF
jgi:hypothetical protein